MHQGFIKVFPEGNLGNRNCSSRGSIEIHPLYPLSGLCLDRRANNNVRACSTRHCTLNEQQILFGIYANHFKILNSYTFGPHLPGHFLTGENTTRTLVLTNGTRCTMRQGVTMSGILCAKVPTLNHALETFTFRSPNHIYLLTFFEDRNRNLCT